VSTFSDVLASRLAHRPGEPLLTFYDDESGERTELSVTTYANWVAKTASLLADELDLERGDRLLVDLPPHWLGPVILGAAWTIGLEVVWDPETEDACSAVVCGPAALDRWAPRAADLPVVATALLPLGVRFPNGAPPGVHDLGVEVWGQPDSFVPWDPPGPDGLAVAGQTHAELWSAASAGTLLSTGGRLLSTANPTSPAGLAAFTEPLARAGSLVLIAHPDPDRLKTTYDSEHATASHLPVGTA